MKDLFEHSMQNTIAPLSDLGKKPLNRIEKLHKS
jgi:hypothetical protein